MVTTYTGAINNGAIPRAENAREGTVYPIALQDYYASCIEEKIAKLQCKAEGK